MSSILLTFCLHLIWLASLPQSLPSWLVHHFRLATLLLIYIFITCNGLRCVACGIYLLFFTFVLHNIQLIFMHRALWIVESLVAKSCTFCCCSALLWLWQDRVATKCNANHMHCANCVCVKLCRTPVPGRLNCERWHIVLLPLALYLFYFITYITFLFVFEAKTSYCCAAVLAFQLNWTSP